MVVYNQGVRLENQQWGEEHGIGISSSGVESIEVIKGPLYVLYGSDAGVDTGALRHSRGLPVLVPRRCGIKRRARRKRVTHSELGLVVHQRIERLIG